MTIFDLTGKTAFITGASSGLGEQFSLTLAQAGARVILVARRLDALKALAQKIEGKGQKAIPVRMDASDKTSIQSVIEDLGKRGEKIDILINSAGISKPTPIFEPDEQNHFEAIMQTNVMGVWHVTKAIAGHMKDRGIAGSVINIASVGGANKLREKNTGYSVSKAAVIHLTKSLVGELSRVKIRINCILPGLFHTPLSHYRLSTPEARKEMADLIPLGFVPEPSELDGAILYLASNNASRYVTGSCLTVDGGVSWGGIEKEKPVPTS